jgi:hypothetical protein
MNQPFKWPVLAGIAIGVTFALALVSTTGLRIASPRISRLPAASSRSLSPSECQSLCNESIIPLKGVTPAATRQQLQTMLVTKFGELSGKELYDAYRDRRMIVAKDKLFFPTEELCRQQNLRGECADLCPDGMRSR